MGKLTESEKRLVANRRDRLARWFSDGYPENERSYISQLVSGKSSFGSKAARRIEGDYGMPEMYLDTTGDDSIDQVSIPQYDAHGSMGGGLLLRDQSGVIQNLNVSRDWINKNVKNCTAVENLCVVTGFGDSMRPMFNSGDPLLLDSGVKALEGDAVYFFRVGDEGFIKRLQRIPGDGIRAISENKGYESWTIRPDMDFEIFGRIIKVWCSEDF